MTSVPEWNTYYPSLSTANKLQKDFYKHFSDSLDDNRSVDIGDNLSYVFLYLYKTVDTFLKDKKIEPLIERFQLINKDYGQIEKISVYINVWLKDAYLYEKDFENAWKYLKKNKYIRIEELIYIRGNCEETSIEANELFKILMSNKGLTKFGQENIDYIAKLTNIFLNDFYVENKKNYLDYFLNQFDYENLTNEDLELLKSCFSNVKDFILWKDYYFETQDSKNPYPRINHSYMFAGLPFEAPFYEREEIPYIIAVALENKFKEIIREAENTVRTERNLPLVGEGWISETELFYKLLQHFSNEKVVHHGKPLWLDRQHVDIYFPHRNIAIEYQGLQHIQPVNYFGGEESFKKQQALDDKKKKLCSQNNCSLIYVYENYNFIDLTKQIENIINCR